MRNATLISATLALSAIAALVATVTAGRPIHAIVEAPAVRTPAAVTFVTSSGSERDDASESIAPSAPGGGVRVRASEAAWLDINCDGGLGGGLDGGRDGSPYHWPTATTKRWSS